MNYADLGEGRVGGNDTIVGETSMGSEWEVQYAVRLTKGNVSFEGGKCGHVVAEMVVVAATGTVAVGGVMMELWFAVGRDACLPFLYNAPRPTPTCTHRAPLAKVPCPGRNERTRGRRRGRVQSKCSSSARPKAIGT